MIPTLLGAKVGIPPQIIPEVISPSRMGNGFFETFMSYVVDRNRDAHRFTIANAAKDLGYLNDMASDARVMNVMAGAARRYSRMSPPRAKSTITSPCSATMWGG